MWIRFLSSFLLCLQVTAQATEYKLYYLGGQSNMDGYGYVDELPDALRAPVEGVMIYTGLTALDDDPGGGLGLWEPLRPGHGTGFKSDGQENVPSDRFGPELSFARTMRELNPEARIAIVKYSLGGSGLAPGIGYGSWDPEYAEAAGINQYDHALRTIRDALGDMDIDGDGTPDRLVPAGIVWMQGETDAHNSGEAAEAYRDNLKRMMDLLRAALRVDDLPVVIGKITHSGKHGDQVAMPYIATVQEAQRAFAESDACASHVAETDDLSYDDDPWHYNSEGYLAMGRAFAEHMRVLEMTCGNWVERRDPALNTNSEH